VHQLEELLVFHLPKVLTITYGDYSNKVSSKELL
jgi:hypothetical protein